MQFNCISKLVEISGTVIVREPAPGWIRSRCTAHGSVGIVLSGDGRFEWKRLLVARIESMALGWRLDCLVVYDVIEAGLVSHAVSIITKDMGALGGLE